MTLLFETESKTVPITKDMVRKAYQKVKSNQGSAGIDKESLEQYQTPLARMLWDGMCGGHPCGKERKSLIEKAVGLFLFRVQSPSVR